MGKEPELMHCLTVQFKFVFRIVYVKTPDINKNMKNQVVPSN